MRSPRQDIGRDIITYSFGREVRVSVGRDARDHVDTSTPHRGVRRHLETLRIHPDHLRGGNLITA